MSVTKKPFYSVVHNKAENKGEIFLYGIIGASIWEQGNDSKQFVLEFKILEREFSRIDIHINSPGGSVWDGLPMYNVIRSSSADTHTYCDGIAYSMGFMIFLAGKTSHAAKGSLLMCHNVLGGVYGNAKDLRSAASMMDKHDEILCDLIVSKSGKDKDFVMSNWMNFEDNFFTPTEAKDSGLVDVIEDYDAKEVPKNLKNISRDELVAFFQNYNSEPSQSFLDKVIEGVKDFFNPQNSNTDMGLITTNKFKSLSALAKVAAAAITADQVKAVNDEIEAEGISGVSFVLDADMQETIEAAAKVVGLEASISAKDTEIQNLKNKITAHEATISEQKTKLDAAAENPDTPPKEEGDKTAGEGNKDDKVIKTPQDLEYEKIQALQNMIP
ncbi:ATP-dependent Clp endopeptidase proteolytic subunit ClpP [Arcticibacter tournemirensis]|uniref:ATP-dependent Clp protease proteolytic subunit n=1 Tax=Arcticibacter tournemirensis TaxID=699437 RepID=A0A5M9HDR1_9SPHI|nr:head maturation protease, ClpP-related [Arcticibacter tournemirensis]KAA8483751.1 Clp protease ClpP [Arcticibacter tournemirensis]TQM50050.1 ATP-dependent Clp endopeptidase proteolytic subunit ClpP [Arcticibacter tournemirensis]